MEHVGLRTWPLIIFTIVDNIFDNKGQVFIPSFPFSFINLSQKYGDIFSIFVGTKPVVVLNSWTLISEGSHLTLYYLHITQGGF